MARAFGFGQQVEGVRPDGGADQQVAEDRRQSQRAEDGDDEDGSAEQQQDELQCVHRALGGGNGYNLPQS